MLHRAWLVLPLLAASACASVPVNETDNPTANFVQVSEGIYRGARPDRAALERLKALSFRAILNLEDDDGAIAEERATLDALGMRQISVPMNGMKSPSNDGVTEALSVLADPEQRPIFVHCMKGMDRTGAVIAMHRVFNEGWSGDDAYSEMNRLGFNSILLSLKEYVEKKIGIDD